MYAKIFYNWILVYLLFILNRLIALILWIMENSLNPLVRLNNKLAEIGENKQHLILNYTAVLKSKKKNRDILK